MFPSGSRFGRPFSKRKVCSDRSQVCRRRLFRPVTLKQLLFDAFAVIQLQTDQMAFHHDLQMLSSLLCTAQFARCQKWVSKCFDPTAFSGSKCCVFRFLESQATRIHPLCSALCFKPAIKYCKNHKKLDTWAMSEHSYGASITIKEDEVYISRVIIIPCLTSPYIPQKHITLYNNVHNI